MTIFQTSRRVEKIEAQIKRERNAAKCIKKLTPPSPARPLAQAKKCLCCGFTILGACPSCGDQEKL